MVNVSVVIPVFNNEGSINKLVEELNKIKDSLTNSNKKIEVIFVDDGSKDRSFEILKNIKQRNEYIKIIKLRKNYGANEATQLGLKKANGNFISVLSADLQDDPQLILKMYELCSHGENLVICERQTREDNFSTKLFSKMFYLLLRKSVMVNFPKNGFDVFMINKKYLDRLNLDNINPTISIMIATLGVKYKKIFYDRKKREHGKSQWTLSKKLNLFWNIFIRYSDLPIKFISRIGLSISVMSFIYVFYIIFVKIFFDFPVPGFATIVTSIAFFSGLIIFILGIMGEYLIRIFKILDKNEEIQIEEALD